MSKRTGRGSVSRQRWLDAGKTVPFPEDLAGRAMFDEVLGELRLLGHRPLWARFVAWFRGASDGEVREALEAMRARRKAREEAAARELELDAWESQAFSLPASHARLRGSLVWMYHGTSSAAREDVLRRGILLEPPGRSWRDTTAGWVYLTGSPGWGPCGAASYAARAARELGGEPEVLRVIVPWDDTEPDLDDRDLPCAKSQRRVPYTVPPAAVFEIDGARARGRIDGGYVTAMGLWAGLDLRTPSGTLRDALAGSLGAGDR
jgi:hypothetical protein